MISETEVEIQKLQREILKLQKDNKSLHVRAQGVQVLGKVLQDSQEENIRLKHEVDSLKEKLVESGTGEPYAYLARYDSKSSYSEHASRSVLSSQLNSSNFNYSNVNGPETGNTSEFSSGLPSFYNGDLHVKEVHNKLQHLKLQYEELTEQAKKLKESVCEASSSGGGDEDVQGKLEQFYARLEMNRREARTRETLARALASEEQEMKEKLQAMEAEQMSYENAIAQLERTITEGKEEFEHLRGEVNLLKEVVLVKKEDHGDSSCRESPCSSVASNNTSGAPVQGTVTVKSAAMTGTSGDCGRCVQLQRQNSELQRQLEEVKNERDEANRQKEEILDVNHSWDTQYRKLQTETAQEINDLKQQNEILKAGDSTQRFDKLWLSAKSMIDKERQAKEQAIEEKMILEEGNKALEEEKKELQVQVDQIQTHISTLQQRLHLMTALQRGKEGPVLAGCRPHQNPANISSISEVHPNFSGISLPPPPPPPVDPSIPSAVPAQSRSSTLAPEPSPEIIDQIEALKQQLRVYADDFQSERSDRERMQSEKDALKETLDAVQQQVLVLEEQVRIYAEDFHKEKREKEELQQQMRALQGGGSKVYSYQAPRIQDLSRRVQSVAEQQAKVKAIREVHEREQRMLLREQQELQQQALAQERQQQHVRRYSPNFVPPYVPHSGGRYDYGQGSQAAFLRARGPIESPTDRGSRPVDEMFRGGEVLPDRGIDVEDGASANKDGKVEKKEESAGILQKECPRCLRKFDQEEAMITHIEKCIP